MADYDSLSRFNNQPLIVTPEGVTTLGLWTVPNFLQPGFLAQSEITTLKVTSDLAGRPDLIANNLYQSPDLDWIIIMYNKPLNPLGWPTTGTIITAPTRAAVTRYLGSTINGG